ITPGADSATRSRKPSPARASRCIGWPSATFREAANRKSCWSGSGSQRRISFERFNGFRGFNRFKGFRVTPRVLVVEDEPHIRELVCLHLGLEGYACEGVGDGRQALTRAEQDRFDLLVLDVMIPGLDGFALTRAVRNGRVNHDVPILMLTAR